MLVLVSIRYGEPDTTIRDFHAWTGKVKAAAAR